MMNCSNNSDVIQLPIDIYLLATDHCLIVQTEKLEYSN